MRDGTKTPPPYGAASRRKSWNLIFLLIGLLAFGTVVFMLLHAFGRNFGAQV